MEDFKKFYKMKKPIISPVIHVLNDAQVITNINTYLSVGVNHVFLINHVTDAEELIETTLNMRTLFPDLWIGMNPLGCLVEEALSYDLPIDALWLDQTVQIYQRNFKGLVFGGLSFKYQRQPSDLGLACEEAKLYTDVACTSGTGTGKAPSTFKIIQLRELLGDHPLAIASGVSAENVFLYKDLVDYLLVATSITDRGELINVERLKQLIDAIQ